MRRYLLFACLGSLLATNAVHAQSAKRHTYFKLNPTTLINELDLYLEQELSPSTSLEIGAGGIYTDYWDRLLNQFDFGQIKPNLSTRQYLQAKGVAGRIGFRYYIIAPDFDNLRARGTYFEPLLLFKQVWYPTDHKTIDEEKYPENGNKRIWGLQLLVGRQHRNGRWIIDKYFGLGVKAKTYSFDNYKTNSATGKVQNDNDHTTSWLPSIQLGIKIGLAGKQ
ncbi:hypothetical protein [Compostibacter hankyongensis]|uniref:DUF3575 domain-containing protein n=1 Tax=Compostibacter hankyongensis TaxID=1007089 RepID=A0ABP8FDT0_9BACT